MNGKRSTVFPALMAIAIAIGVIGFGIYAGIPINLTTTSSTTGQGLTTSIGATSQSQSSSQSLTTASQSSQTASQSASQSLTQSVSQTSGGQQTASSSSSTSTGGGQGSLSILLTDPPNIAQGVTKVYVTYTNLEVHLSGAPDQSGWTQVQSQGQIELLGTQNVSKTLSSVSVATGVYDQLRFNMSAAEITYNFQNYTAFVQTAELVVPIVHGVPVNATGPTAALIDISPTVVNIGSPSTPEFIIRPVAVAYPVPSGEVTSTMQLSGGQVSLLNASWWQTIVHQSKTSLAIGSVTLTSSRLSLTVANTGNNSTLLSLVIVSPLIAPVSVGYLPGSFYGAAVFSVLPNGTLVPQRGILPPVATLGATEAAVSPIVFRSIGYNLTAGASVNLSYNGFIHLGFLSATALGDAIVPGQKYLVTVLGTATTTSTIVVAS